MHEFRYAPPPDEGVDALLVYADRSLLVVSKPFGLLSVPGRGPDKADCLVSRLRTVFPDALIVHRLDMDTSGLLVLARGAEMHRALSIAFQERQVDKRYIAVVDGELPGAGGEINLPLVIDWPNRPRQMVDHEHGRPSLTRWRALGYDAASDSSRVELEPVTGRSHRLRVHLMSLGHPILGDTLYASPAARDKAARLQLHAAQLAFDHPVSGKRLSFSNPPPF